MKRIHMICLLAAIVLLSSLLISDAAMLEIHARYINRHDAGMDIADTMAAKAKFRTLLFALGSADLVDILKDGGAFTVFAPTDEAFAKLGEDTLEDLLKPENKDRLTAILKYHIVRGRLTAAQIKDIDSIETLNGRFLSVIKTEDSTLKINQATIIEPDIMCRNGIIQAIDTVLMPQ